MSTWYTPMTTRTSAGQRVPKAGGLSELAARRVAHQGQFFTPTDVAAVMWELALTAFGDEANTGLHILDNSVGSGRLLQFARAQDSVYGCDIDADTLRALGDAMEAGGVKHDLLAVGMENVAAEGMDVALINPPFSLHLESPRLTAYPCCAYGKFGPSTAALSHWYSLYQAMAASRAVIALLPSSVVDQLNEHPEIERALHAVVRLPVSTFVNEGAEVSTVLLALGAPRPQGRSVRIGTLDEARAQTAAFAPAPLPEGMRPPTRFASLSVRTGAPTITGPVTGDDRVRIYRSGRNIKFRFACAFTHARVINAVLESPLGFRNHLQNRYPAGIEYRGSARLLTEVLLCGTTPTEYLDRLCAIIRAVDGIPEPDRDLLGYLARRWRAVQVERTPLQRTIYDPDGEHSRASLDGACVTVVKTHLCDPASFSSPLARAGQDVTLVRVSDCELERYRYSLAPNMPPLSVDQLRELVQLPAISSGAEWVQIEAGRAAAFPERAAAIDRRLSQAGADPWLGGWKFQRDDVIELCMTRGAIAGHLMALGKSRIAAGCCLAGGQHNAIVVEAGLVPEMLAQFKEFGLPSDQYKVIRKLGDLEDLRRINLISYNTLRKPIGKGSRVTFAARLRRRFHTVCADEGSVLSHTDTAQTQALHRLSATRRIALDGTPIASYPRNVLPMVCWASREGTASQPYGMRSAYITGELFSSAYSAERGIDRFREQFVVTEWVTHQFEDDLQSGGKREIPSLANLDLYRQFIGRHILRRVWGEPAVEAHVSMPKPECSTVEVAWDSDHLETYVATAEDFVDWWKAQRPDVPGQKLNLVSVLLRLGAACRAASIPQDLKGPHAWTGGLTSKQRWCVDTLENLHADGGTVLCFFESPLCAALVGSALRARGVDALEFTGLSSPTQRTTALDTDFRTGKTRIILMTFGVGARGLNLPQASHVVFYDRMWTPRQEEQAMYRALRVGRKGVLKVIYAHLTGSVDLYKAQMVAFKQDTSNAGLDFATPEFSPSDFEHWMTILDNFCQSIGKARIELRRARNDAGAGRLLAA
ncbi:helicase [Sinimarinibacterium sp. CAU 1509]|uniref:helicase-related protein n=1 Tax=Sinimarinibacterium sp. CAU 1509 TaxID=2562283 RepID=UPI0010ABF62A|nr:helicase-related protein [Sinimarinibacterium sp. CAU 1509]TJY57210.1 helicase [Sinimarinibacterium sp. CAU 1509]